MKHAARLPASIVSVLIAGSAVALATAQPVDCLPDAIVRWQAAAPAPDSRFGANTLPGIVLGPPGDSSPTQGSTTVASIGPDGSVTLRFDDVLIEDRPGPDFIVFENAFFVGSVPSNDAADYTVFTEPGFVDVSLDGTAWIRFPYDAQALTEATAKNANKSLQHRLAGLAGITPTFTGNWTIPDSLQTWDSSGQGGVSGAGGDAFDLATVGLAQARFIRLTDAGSRNGPSGSAEGFDLDAVVVLHGRPNATSERDSDGDRLPDSAESSLYASNPFQTDSDGDGIDDGREVASCRNPNSVDSAAWFVREPRLWLRAGVCTELRWSFMATGISYDLIRGDVASLAAVGAHVDLGAAICLQDNLPSVRFSCDSAKPLVGQSYFYLVRPSTVSNYGWSSSLAPRLAGSGCP